MAQKVWRLLRDDEPSPLVEGIVAKKPLVNDSAVLHIRNGTTRKTQWISTSKDLKAVEKFIKLKRKREGVRTTCRVVEIDLHLLRQYAVNNVFADAKHQTGQILDFTDPSVLNSYLPFNPARPTQHERTRGYATKYREVLVERYIPAWCCTRIITY